MRMRWRTTTRVPTPASKERKSKSACALREISVSAPPRLRCRGSASALASTTPCAGYRRIRRRSLLAHTRARFSSVPPYTSSPRFVLLVASVLLPIIVYTVVRQVIIISHRCSSCCACTLQCMHFTPPYSPVLHMQLLLPAVSDGGLLRKPVSAGGAAAAAGSGAGARCGDTGSHTAAGVATSASVSIGGDGVSITGTLLGSSQGRGRGPASGRGRGRGRGLPPTSSSGYGGSRAASASPPPTVMADYRSFAKNLMYVVLALMKNHPSSPVSTNDALSTLPRPSLHCSYLALCRSTWGPEVFTAASLTQMQLRRAIYDLPDRASANDHAFAIDSIQRYVLVVHMLCHFYGIPFSVSPLAHPLTPTLRARHSYQLL